MSDLSVWQQASDNSLIEHILARYHQVHRVQLADILPLAEKVAGVHAGTFPADILPLLQHMRMFYQQMSHHNGLVFMTQERKKHVHHTLIDR